MGKLEKYIGTAAVLASTSAAASSCAVQSTHVSAHETTVTLAVQDAPPKPPSSATAPQTPLKQDINMVQFQTKQMQCEVMESEK